MRALATLLLGLGAGCAPHLIWSGHDARRELAAEVFATGSQQWLQSGGEVGPRFEQVDTSQVVFAPDGSRLAYPAMLEGRWWMIVGEERLGPWEDVAEPRFGGNGRRFAFLARAPDGWHVVTDGTAGPALESIQPRTLGFSEDGTHLGYVAREGRCPFAVVDGTALACQERIRSLGVTNLGTVVMVIREGRKERFLVGDQRGPPCDAIGEWGVTADGRHSAYAAQGGSGWTVFVDGVASAECTRVQHLRYGNAGHLSWVCSGVGGATVFVDGVAGMAWPLVSAPVLASRASDIAYVARDEQGAWVISEGGRQGPFADARNLVLPPEGGDPVFLARIDGKIRVVHQGRTTPLGAAVEGSLVVSDDGQHWAVVDGDPAERSLWLVVDGRRVRRLGPEEVFGETRQQLSGWLGRELDEVTHEGARAAGR